jgi:MFS family permease
VLWIGTSAATVGVSVADIAYPLAILAITHSPALAGLFAAVQGLGLLLAGLPAGALADRYDSRRIVIITETARAVVTAAVAVRSMPSAHSITRCRSWSPRARSWSRSSPRR